MKNKTIGVIVLGVIIIIFGIPLCLYFKDIVDETIILIILTGFYATVSFFILLISWLERLNSTRREIIEKIFIPIRNNLDGIVSVLKRYVKGSSIPSYSYETIKKQIPHLFYNNQISKKLYDEINAFSTLYQEYSPKHHLLFEKIDKIVLNEGMNKFSTELKKQNANLEKIRGMEIQCKIKTSEGSRTLAKNLIHTLYFGKLNLDEYIKRETEEYRNKKYEVKLEGHFGNARTYYIFFDNKRFINFYSVIKEKIDENEEINRLLEERKLCLKEASKLKEKIEKQIKKWS